MEEHNNSKKRRWELFLCLLGVVLPIVFAQFLSSSGAAPQPTHIETPTSTGDFFTISTNVAGPLKTIGIWIAGLFSFSMFLRIFAIFEIFDVFDRFSGHDGHDISDDLGDLLS